MSAMRGSFSALIPLLTLLLLCAGSDTLRADQQDGSVQVVQRDINKVLAKTDADLLRKLVGLAGKDPALRRKVTEELIDSVYALDGHAAALEEFVENLRGIRSSAELTQLASGNKLRAYAASLRETHLARFKGQGDDLLRSIVGQGDGAADAAGAEALALLRRAEEQIAKNGAIPSLLDKRLASALRQLSPARARAARQLVRNQLAAKGTNLFNAFTRTGVDGLFVLSDAYAISAMEDGGEKAAEATESAVGFGLEVVGNAAVRAAGGGFFLHGLVVSLSSAKVAELVSEIIMLQYDRENAAMQEQWADMELRLDAIRGMLRVDALIKQGQFAKAQSLLTKVKHFYFNRPLLAAQGDDLYATMQELEHKASRGEQLQRANAVIAEARIPYLQGYRLAHQGRLLSQARTLVAQSEQILRDSVRIYPELQPPLDQVRLLLTLIERIRANPPKLGQPTVSGPDQVMAGEVATFEVHLQGGIPDYQPIGINGTALPTGALLFWEAPQQPGSVSLSARLKDDNGSIVEVHKRIKVVAAAEPDPTHGELRLRAYVVQPSYSKDGVINPAKQVEAHDVYTWDNVHFEANIQNPDYRYQWSVNGKLEPSPYVKHVYTVPTDTVGVYRIVLKVWDSQGRPLGTAEWTVRSTEYVPVYE